MAKEAEMEDVAEILWDLQVTQSDDFAKDLLGLSRGNERNVLVQTILMLILMPTLMVMECGRGTQYPKGCKEAYTGRQIH